MSYVPIRITPACAGKTREGLPGLRRAADHPRMRGEDMTHLTEATKTSGSPPHARGRLSHSSSVMYRDADHPRMRGEDLARSPDCCGLVGSPPHARGRPLGDVAQRAYARITPACAGKTGGGVLGWLVWGDHPRMRGEDSLRARGRGLPAGSPPHARGRPPVSRPRSGNTWITPACAGKTMPLTSLRESPPDHPRMRAEDTRWTIR